MIFVILCFGIMNCNENFIFYFLWKDFFEFIVNFNYVEKLRIGIDLRNYYNIVIFVCWWFILKNMKINVLDLKFLGLCDSNIFV